MELFDIFRWVLIVVVSVAVLFPLNIPMAALAYKIQIGPKPIDMETSAFWYRSTGVAGGLALGAIVLTLVDAWLVSMDLPAGIVHFTLFLLYVPPGIFYVFWMFAFEDVLEGFNVLLIYLSLPGILFALFLGFGIHLPPMGLIESWILPTAT